MLWRTDNKSTNPAIEGVQKHVAGRIGRTDQERLSVVGELEFTPIAWGREQGVVRDMG